MKYRFTILLTTIILVSIVCIGSMYISSVNQFFPLVYLIVLGPFMLFVCIYFSRKIETKYLKFDTNLITKLFGLSALGILIFSIVEALLLENILVYIQLHDTYFVIGHYLTLMLTALFMGFWAIIYYITPKLIKRNLNKKLSEIHFWLTFFGTLVLIILMQISAISMSPRRYYSFGIFDPFIEYGYINAAISIVAILLLTSQIIYFVNLVFSIYQNRKIES
jgi:cytochrome c oxidase subunit 1